MSDEEPRNGRLSRIRSVADRQVAAVVDRYVPAAVNRYVPAAVDRHTPTVVLVELLVFVYVVEWYVATRFGGAAYEWLFVASVEPTPGWLLAPFAHQLGHHTHLVSSVIVLLVFGQYVQQRFPGWRYAGFCLLAGYLSVGAQVSTYLFGEVRGTLGASGIALAMVAFVAVDVGRRHVASNGGVDRWDAGFATVGWVLLVQRFERDVGVVTPAVDGGAFVGHLAGVAVGTLCALWLAGRQR